MSMKHEIYKIGNRYIVVNAEGRYWKRDKPISLQEAILRKLNIKPLFVFRTMGGMYRMKGVINARKYFADNRMAKLMRVADGVETKVQKARKEVRKSVLPKDDAIVFSYDADKG